MRLWQSRLMTFSQILYIIGGYKNENTMDTR